MSMFDIINRKPEIKPGVHSMSDEEELLQLEKIDLLKYQNALLERLCWVGSPGRLEFPAFQKMLREEFNASSKPIPAPLHGDVRT